MKHSLQMSETLRLGIILALSGGFMDAYSYLERGNVFANAQTGNLLLFGVNLAEGNYFAMLSYLLPVLAFTLGILLADTVRCLNIRLHWRQLSVLLEAVILICVAFFPHSLNPLANSLTSFACGIQVESFRKIRNRGAATTMCIGNLRSGTAALSFYLREKKPEQLRQAMYYFGIIVLFAVGAGIGGNLSANYGIHMIWVSCGFLMVSFLLMFVEKYKHFHEEYEHK